MGRAYAGMLGPLAFVTVVARGLFHGGHADCILPVACGCLFAFAALGYVVGRIAEALLRETVLAGFRAQLARQQRVVENGSPATT